MNKAHKWLHSNIDLGSKKTWTAADRQAIIEGVEIVKALPAARDFCSMAHRYPMESRVAMLISFMKQLANTNTHETTTARPYAPRTSATHPAAKPAPSNQQPATQDPAQGKDEAYPSKGGKVAAAEQVEEPASPAFSKVLHIDQYFHLLPQELQQKALTIKHEYDLRSDFHNQAHIYADSTAPDAQKTRADIAEMLCHKDDKIRMFYQECDAVLAKHGLAKFTEEDMEQLQALGARIKASEKKGDGEYTYDELQRLKEEAGDDAEKLEHIAYLEKQRIENRRKYIRKPINRTPDRRAKVREAVGELKKFGVKLSPKMIQVALQCGMKKEELC